MGTSRTTLSDGGMAFVVDTGVVGPPGPSGGGFTRTHVFATAFNSQSLTGGGTQNTIIWDSVDDDPNTLLNTNTGVINVGAFRGYWLITGVVSTSAPISANSALAVIIGGAYTYRTNILAGAYSADFSIVGIAALNDQITVEYYLDGLARTVAAAPFTRLRAVYLGPGAGQ